VIRQWWIQVWYMYEIAGLKEAVKFGLELMFKNATRKG